MEEVEVESEEVLEEEDEVLVELALVEVEVEVILVALEVSTSVVRVFIKTSVTQPKKHASEVVLSTKHCWLHWVVISACSGVGSGKFRQAA